MALVKQFLVCEHNFENIVRKQIWVSVLWILSEYRYCIFQL